MLLHITPYSIICLSHCVFALNQFISNGNHICPASFIFNSNDAGSHFLKNIEMESDASIRQLSLVMFSQQSFREHIWI